jgi:hypothetical protein
VARDEALHALPPEVLERHPELEGPEATCLLGAILGEPRQPAEPLSLLRAQVGRHQAERVAEDGAIPQQRRAALDGNREPFMRIQSDRVRAGKTAETRRALRGHGGDRPVGAVHVQPQPLAGTEIGQLIQRIDGARRHRSGAGHHAERDETSRAVAGHRLRDGAGIESEVAVGR